MCRIAAFPPNFPRNEALEILSNFENKNTDGTGVVYLQDGQFVVNKWAKSFSWVVKNRSFLTHMPYNKGWTLVHLRAASHGNNRKENTHPFVVGPWAIIHNGIWTEHNLVKLALSNTVKMKGETDSEVAANFWNIIGPKQFSQVVDYSGVFMGLNKNGHLWVAKTSGDLEIQALKHNQVLLASEFDILKYPNRVDGVNGWYHFGPFGNYIKHKENVSRWSSNYPYRNGTFNGSNSCCNSGQFPSVNYIYDAHYDE
jgi:hypothetical protein